MPIDHCLKVGITLSVTLVFTFGGGRDLAQKWKRDMHVINRLGVIEGDHQVAVLHPGLRALSSFAKRLLTSKTAWFSRMKELSNILRIYRVWIGVCKLSTDVASC